MLPPGFEEVHIQSVVKSPGAAATRSFTEKRKCAIDEVKFLLKASTLDSVRLLVVLSVCYRFYYGRRK